MFTNLYNNTRRTLELAVYKNGKKTSDINVQADFNVKDVKDDAYVKNRPNSTLSISIDGVVQEKTYNPNTGSETININVDELIEDRDAKISESINNLDSSDTLQSGKYYTGMTEKDGIVTMSQADMDSTPTSNSKKPVTSAGIKSYIDTKQSNTKYTDTADSTKYVSAVNQTDGKISVSRETLPYGYKNITDGTVTISANNKEDTLNIEGSDGVSVLLNPENNKVTLSHSNVITGSSSYKGSATSIPRIKYDNQGHITACTTTTVYPPTTAGEAGQVWKSNGSGVGSWSNLDAALVGSDGSYIKTIKEEKGIVTAVPTKFDTEISASSTDNNAPTSKAVYTAIQSLGNLYRIQPSVSNIEELNKLTNNKEGDVRNVTSTGDNYVWDGTSWDALGGTTIVDALNMTSPEVSNEEQTSFISDITQVKGVVSAVKSKLPIASTKQPGIVSLSDSVSTTSSSVAATSTAVKTVNDNLDTHINDTDNPHSVTKAQVGLGDVTNVSTVNTITSGSKSNITSGAVYTALSGKVDKTNGVTNVAYDSDNKQFSKTINGTTSSIVSVSALKSDMELDNVTNDAQVKGLASGTKENNVVIFGADGYTIKDSGLTIGKSVPADAVFTDRYVNSISIKDDSTNTASPVKVTLTRAGSDSATVVGNIPKVSGTSAGVVPKGAAVSSQSQSTKFLREDGTWAVPSYTTENSLTIGTSSTQAAAGDHKHTKEDITDFPTSLPASDVSSWAKADTKPTYSYSEITDKPNHIPFTEISKGNINFNNYTAQGVYYPAGDMNTWGTISWTNAPTTNRPEGGFSLVVLKEGNYTKQILTLYNSPRVYMRYTYYDGSAVKWGSWNSLSLTSDTVKIPVNPTAAPTEVGAIWVTV